MFKKNKVFTRLITVIVMALCAACGSGSNSGGDSNETNAAAMGLIGDDAISEPLSGGERELLVSDSTAVTLEITQCFCSLRFRSTLKFYHFENQNTVLMIEFDNQTSDFTRTASMVIFDASASAGDVSKWINNQHSDGLHFDDAAPVASYLLPTEAISITSTGFVEKQIGGTGDEYEETQIEFTVANLSEPGRYYLNGFADQGVVFLQTR